MKKFKLEIKDLLQILTFIIIIYLIIYRFRLIIPREIFISNLFFGQIYFLILIINLIILVIFLLLLIKEKNNNKIKKKNDFQLFLGDVVDWIKNFIGEKVIYSAIGCYLTNKIINNLIKINKLNISLKPIVIITRFLFLFITLIDVFYFSNFNYSYKFIFLLLIPLILKIFVSIAIMQMETERLYYEINLSINHKDIKLDNNDFYLTDYREFKSVEEGFNWKRQLDDDIGRLNEIKNQISLSLFFSLFLRIIYIIIFGYIIYYFPLSILLPKVTSIKLLIKFFLPNLHIFLIIIMLMAVSIFLLRK